MLAAVARGRGNVVSALLATGTDPDYSERGGDPALFTALEYGHVQVRVRTHTRTHRTRVCVCVCVCVCEHKCTPKVCNRLHQTYGRAQAHRHNHTNTHTHTHTHTHTYIHLRDFTMDAKENI